MKKMEFSKKILIVAGILNVLVIGFSCWMMWKTENLEPLAYVNLQTTENLLAM